MSTVPQDAPERFPIKLPAGFDPTRHLDGLKQQVGKMYPNASYSIENIDLDALTASAIRERNVSEVYHDTKVDARVVNLVKGTKVSDGDAMAAKFEAQFPGYSLTDFEPFLQKARLTRLSVEERRARDALAVALGVKPWEVKIRSAAGGGFDLVLPKNYVPSKHDDKLQEVVETAIGDAGWFIQTNSKTLRGRIVPGDPPTFDPAYPFDFSKLPQAESVSDKELWRIPLGVGLAPRGEKNKPIAMDLSDSVGDLLVGLAGSGKAQPLSTLIPVPIQSRFPDGWATVGSLEVGDLVYAGDGSATALVGFSDPVDAEVYEVHLSDGQVVRAHANHLWKASHTVARSVHTPKMVARRDAHRDEYEKRAEELREFASTVDPTMSATLGDIAKMIGYGETSLYSMNLPIKHLAKEAALIGGGTTRNITIYPIDEVVNLISEHLDRQSRTDRRNREVMSEETIVTTKEMMRTLRYGKIQRANWAIRLGGAIDGEDIDLTVPGYTLGAWLGDGTARRGEITTMDMEIVREIEMDGYSIRSQRPNPGRSSAIVFDGLRDDLCKTLDADGQELDKRIPAQYLRASAETRLAVLQGLMDTDGTISSTGSCELGLSKHDLAIDALELIRSLGIKASISERTPHYVHKGERERGRTSYRIKFTTTQPVFRLPRKLDRVPNTIRETQRLLYVTDIRVAGREKMRCLKVAHPEHLYLTDGFVPTHNSVATQAIAFSALARGWQLALINTVDKATDFAWAKPFVKDHMWGCDTVAQSVTVAKLVIEEGEKRGSLLSQYGASKWQDLPADVKRDNPPLLLIADELASLLTADPLPSGLSKEMKELPEFIKMQQDLLESKLLATALSKIPAVYRAAGIRVIYLTQQPNERYGFSTKLKGNLPHRVMLGVSPSQSEKGHAFRTPEKVPDVPKNIAQDDTLSRGVGLAHLDGHEPVVFKGFYAPLDAYLAEAKRRGFPVTMNPEPTPRQIERLVPTIGGDEEMFEEEKKYGKTPKALEDWEIDPETGKPLDARQRANAAKHRLTVDAKGA